jgi:hypothetical protein
LKEPLSAIKPMKAVFDHEYVKRINGPNVKKGGSKMDKARCSWRTSAVPGRPTAFSRW